MQKLTITGLLFSVVVLLFLWGSGAGEEPGRAPADRLQPERGPAPRLSALPTSRGSAVEREVATLSLDETRAQLPENPYRINAHRERSVNRRDDLLFRRLGALLGAGALDEILERYGRESGFAVHAMGMALAGWMSVDPAAASSALSEIAGGIDDISTAWMGEPVRVPDYCAFGGLVLQGSLAPGVQELARSDPERALKLLREDSMQDHFAKLLSAYTRGLGSGTDWMEVKEGLDRLMAERGDPLRTWDPVPLALAKGWARSDLDAALGWYLEHKAPGGDGGSKQVLIPVLLSLDGPERARATSWMEENLASGSVGDGFVRCYAMQLLGDEADSHTQRVISLPGDEAVREAILSTFAKPRATSNPDRPKMLYPAEALYPLVAAAKLSPERDAHWRSVVESNAHLPVDR